MKTDKGAPATPQRDISKALNTRAGDLSVPADATDPLSNLSRIIAEAVLSNAFSRTFAPQPQTPGSPMSNEIMQTLDLWGPSGAAAAAPAPGAQVGAPGQRPQPGQSAYYPPAP